MGVNLSGRQRGMAEDFLHAAQVSATLQEVGRRSVAQAVRPGVRYRPAGGRDPGVHDPAHGPRVDPAAAGTEE